MKILKVYMTTWFTTLTPSFEKPFIESSKPYNPEDYPEYDNYNAIEVSRTQNIPKDFTGVMGVPIFFIDKYNPEQFEVLGLDRDTCPKEVFVGGRLAMNGKKKYARILIKHKQLFPFTCKGNSRKEIKQ